MEIFVFSYNRGEFLRNCLESIRRHAGDCLVTVIDDASSDPAVDAALAEYSDAVRVVNSTDAIRGHYVGGLYPNMNHAIRIARSDHALFIQDDMQIVRDIEHDDLEHARRYFRNYPRSLELHTCFLKGLQGPASRSDMDIDESVPVYFRRPEGRGTVYFSAVGLFNVPLIREMGFEFSDFEQMNDERIKRDGDRMGISPFPFMMWLPAPRSSKFRFKGPLQRYAEWKTGAGLYPYRAMTHAEVQHLRQRSLATKAVAEDWLVPQGMKPRDTWYFDDAAKLVPIAWKIRKMRKRFRRKWLKQS